METKTETNDTQLHTLIPLEKFKALMGIDDRDDKLARFSLITATFTIEQYCKRKLLRKRYFETVKYSGDLFLTLREYPVRKFLAMYAVPGDNLDGEWNIIDPDFYRAIPDFGSYTDVPYTIELAPAFKRIKCNFINLIYVAGYPVEKMPGDLEAACLEYASWNFNRYKGRRIGMTGNIKGSGKDGEHFEMSMPESVKYLIEPYRRKTI